MMYYGSDEVSYFIVSYGSIGSYFILSQRGSSFSSFLIVSDDSYKSSSILPTFLNLRMGKVPVSLYLCRMSLAVVNFIFNFLMALAIEYPSLLTILTNTFLFCVRINLPSEKFLNMVFWRIFGTVQRPFYQLEILQSKFLFIEALGIITDNEFKKLAFLHHKRSKILRIISLYYPAWFFLFMLFLNFSGNRSIRGVYTIKRGNMMPSQYRFGVVDYIAQLLLECLVIMLNLPLFCIVWPLCLTHSKYTT